MSVTRIPAHFLLQYQSKCYYIIGQEVYYSIGRFITLSGSYYIIGRFLLHYRVLITVSGVITLSVGTTFVILSDSSVCEGCGNSLSCFGWADSAECEHYSTMLLFLTFNVIID